MLNMRVFNCLCRLGAIFLVAFGPLALTLAEANDNINAESEIASNNTSATPSRKDATLDGWVNAFSNAPIYLKDDVSFEDMGRNLEYQVEVGDDAKDAEDLKDNIEVYLSTLPEIKRANLETRRQDITKQI